MAMLELDEADQELLRLILAKELEEIRVEVRHTRTNDFKQQLLEREHRLQKLFDRL